MTDRYIDSKQRRADILSGAGELQRRKTLRDTRRTFRQWPLLPVPASQPATGPQSGPTVDWPPGEVIHGLEDWQDKHEVGADFTPVGEASLWSGGAGQSQAFTRSRALKACLLVSVALHLCCAVFLISMPAPETAEIAGGGAVSVMLVGEQAFDSLAAGKVDGEQVSQPVEQVKAVETAEKPVEATTTEQVVDPVEAEQATSEPLTAPAETPASPPAETANAISPTEQVAQAVPAAQEESPAEEAAAVENHAIAPAAVSETGELQPEPPLAAVEPQPQRPAQAVKEAPAEPSKPVKPAEPPDQPEKKLAEKKPPSQKKVEKPKEERKTAARKPAETDRDARSAPTKNRKGEAGEGTVNTQRGSSSNADSPARSDPGNAAVSNYPGKVAAKLRRALKYPKSAVASSRGETQVAFTVLADGSATGVRIVSSSGSPVLDQAAIEAVRRAAPFPPIPTEAGRRQWPFAVPVLFKR